MNLEISTNETFLDIAKQHLKVAKDIKIEASADPFYSDSNILYLKRIMQDVYEGKAHFAEHNLIEV